MTVLALIPLLALFQSRLHLCYDSVRADSVASLIDDMAISGESRYSSVPLNNITTRRQRLYPRWVLRLSLKVGGDPVCTRSCNPVSYLIITSVCLDWLSRNTR